MKPVVNALIVTDDFGINGTPHGGFLRWQDETPSQAINSATGISPTLSEFTIGAVTEGQDALGEVSVVVEVDGDGRFGAHRPRTLPLRLGRRLPAA